MRAVDYTPDEGTNRQGGIREGRVIELGKPALFAIAHVDDEEVCARQLVDRRVALLERKVVEQPAEVARVPEDGDDAAHYLEHVQAPKFVRVFGESARRLMHGGARAFTVAVRGRRVRRGERRPTTDERDEEAFDGEQLGDERSGERLALGGRQLLDERRHDGHAAVGQQHLVAERAQSAAHFDGRREEGLHAEGTSGGDQ